jgi:hypothetical protein
MHVLEDWLPSLELGGLHYGELTVHLSARDTC